MAQDPLYNMGTEVQTVLQTREKLRKEIELTLGGGMIDLELDPGHYALAIDKALDRYRTRSENAVEESFIFVEVQADQSQYTLANEVIEVRKAYRRGIGTSTGSGAQFDPFGGALISYLYSMPGGESKGNLFTYELAMQKRELLARMFGQDLLFTWDPQSKKIEFHRKFTGSETVLLWAYNYRPDNVLLTEIYARQWLRSWATAECKMMLGEARSTYASIAGPGGGTTLNGDTLKTDAIQEFDRLDLELKNQVAGGSQGYTFIIG